MLIRERVVSPCPTTGSAIFSRPSIRLRVQAWRRRRRQTQLLLLVARRIAALYSAAIGILMRPTDPSIPRIILEAPASSARPGGRVASGAGGARLLVGAARRARVAQFVDLVFDPFERTGGAWGGVVGCGLVGLDEGDVVLPGRWCVAGGARLVLRPDYPAGVGEDDEEEEEEEE